MSNIDNSDKRRGTRVDFETKIVLSVGGSEIHVKGTSKDLSINGIFINLTEDIPINTACSLKVFLTGMTESIVLKMQGLVVRKSPNGVGIDYSSMDLDTYTHLKNIVKYNSLDEEDAL